MGFSPQRITTMIQFLPSVISWWLKHGAMDPLEGPLSWMLTDWTSELSFLIPKKIHNVKQLAVVLSAVLSRSCCLCRPCDTSANPLLLKWSGVAQLETRFSQAGMPSTLHTCSMQDFRLFPASVVTLVSGEVKHVVHLIHLNLNSCLPPMWLDRQWSRLREWRTNF